MNIQLWHNQTQFCHIVELKRTHVTLRLELYEQNIKLINGKASSSTLVEELASHYKMNLKKTN